MGVGALARAVNTSKVTSSQGSAHPGLLRDQSAQRYPHLGECVCVRKNELKCVFVRCAMYVSYACVCVWVGGVSIKSV